MLSQTDSKLGKIETKQREIVKTIAAAVTVVGDLLPSMQYATNPIMPRAI